MQSLLSQTSHLGVHWLPVFCTPFGPRTWHINVLLVCSALDEPVKVHQWRDVLPRVSGAHARATVPWRGRQRHSARTNSRKAGVSVYHHFNFN